MVRCNIYDRMRLMRYVWGDNASTLKPIVAANQCHIICDSRESRNIFVLFCFDVFFAAMNDLNL